MYLEGLLILLGIVCLPLCLYLVSQMKKISKYLEKVEIDYLNMIRLYNNCKGKELEELKKTSTSTPLYKYIEHRYSNMPDITDIINNTNYTDNDKKPWV